MAVVSWCIEAEEDQRGRICVFVFISSAETIQRSALAISLNIQCERFASPFEQPAFVMHTRLQVANYEPAGHDCGSCSSSSSGGRGKDKAPNNQSLCLCLRELQVAIILVWNPNQTAACITLSFNSITYSI